MIRKPNLRYFARDNGVEHCVYEKVWLINFEQFMKKLDPKNRFLGMSIEKEVF